MGKLPKPKHVQKSPLDRLMEKVDPNALTLEQLSKLLTLAGKKPVTSDELKERLAAGAPTNADGTINLLHFTAWLAKGAGQGS